MPTDPGFRRVPTPTIKAKTPRGVDTRKRDAAGNVTYSSGATIGPARKPGQGMPAPVTEPPGYWDQALMAPPQTPGENLNRSGSGGGRGGGGGGPSGPDPAQVRALGNELFQFNAGPWDLMRQQVGNQRNQANAYNPDFASYEATFNQGRAVRDQARAEAVARHLQELAGFGQQLAGQQSGAMQGALRDLSAQGANVNPYLDQANQIAGDRTAMLANQGQYLGQLNASGANASAAAGDTAGLIRQGGETGLANNRGSLLNSLAQQEAQLGMQQAQAQQQNEQARREFMLKYGVL